jgi:hypothetical protein
MFPVRTIEGMRKSRLAFVPGELPCARLSKGHEPSDHVTQKHLGPLEHGYKELPLFSGVSARQLQL